MRERAAPSIKIELPREQDHDPSPCVELIALTGLNGFGGWEPHILLTVRSTGQWAGPVMTPKQARGIAAQLDAMATLLENWL